MVVGLFAAGLLTAVFAERDGALGAQAPAAAQLFRDITRDAGITFQHHAAPERNTSSNR